MIVIILIVLVPLWVSFVLTVIVMMMRLSWCMTVWCPCCDHATCHDDYNDEVYDGADDDGETDYGHDDGDYVDDEDIAAYIACCWQL